MEGVRKERGRVLAETVPDCGAKPPRGRERELGRATHEPTKKAKKTNLIVFIT
jgi:hypothetical protein